MAMLVRREARNEVGLKGPGNRADRYRTGDGWKILMIAAAMGTSNARTSKTKVVAVASGGVTTETESERLAV